MTQQPYQPPPPPPGYGQQPQYQPPPPQYRQPPPPPQQYGYGQPYQQAPPQGPPPAKGTIDAFYQQPMTGGGPGISLVNPGEWVQATIRRDIIDADTQQDQWQGQLKTYRDGNPQFVMMIPLTVTQMGMAQPPQLDDGEATLYVRGQMREELIRAMAEAGCKQGQAPQGGAFIQVMLADKKQIPKRQIPKSIYAIEYRQPDQAQQAVPQAPAQAVETPPPPPPPPGQAPAFQQPQQAAQPPPPPPPPPPPAQGQAPPQGALQPQQATLPAPPNLSPDKAEVLQRVAGNAQSPPQG